jgi:acyl dehydratase
MTIAVETQLDERTFDGISADALIPYLEQSGDDNPLHRDPAVAESIGLPAIPVPGQFVVVMIERYLNAWDQGDRIERVRVQFVSPVFVDRPTAFSARIVAVREGPSIAVIRIRVLQASRLAAVGEAHIRMRALGPQGNVPPACP